jgi:hypothetical protein
MKDPTTYATDREAVEAAIAVINGWCEIFEPGSDARTTGRMDVACIREHLARVVPAKVGASAVVDGIKRSWPVVLLAGSLKDDATRAGESGAASDEEAAARTHADLCEAIRELATSEAEALLREVVNYVHHAPGCKSNDNWSDGFRAPPCDCPLGPLLAKARGFLGRGGG